MRGWAGGTRASRENDFLTILSKRIGSSKMAKKVYLGGYSYLSRKCFYFFWLCFIKYFDGNVGKKSVFLNTWQIHVMIFTIKLIIVFVWRKTIIYIWYYVLVCRQKLLIFDFFLRSSKMATIEFVKLCLNLLNTNV